MDDAFRASAIAKPIVPLAPVSKHTFVDMILSKFRRLELYFVSEDITDEVIL